MLLGCRLAVGCCLYARVDARRRARFSKSKINKTSPATDQDASGRREEEALERQEQAEHFMDERAAEGPQLGRELDHDGEESAASCWTFWNVFECIRLCWKVLERYGVYDVIVDECACVDTRSSNLFIQLFLCLQRCSAHVTYVSTCVCSH